jgi:hypothetical protein
MAVDGGEAAALPPHPLPPPPGPCLLAVAPPPPAHAADAPPPPPVQHQVLTLDGLLDYVEDDKMERTFEVSLFGEAMLEVLQRDATHVLAAALLAAAPVAGGGDGSAGAAGAKRTAAEAGVAAGEGGAAGAGDGGGAAKRPRTEDGGEGGGGGGAPSGPPPAPAPVIGPHAWDIAVAGRLFDRRCSGAIPAGELEAALRNGGMRLSRLGARALVARGATEGGGSMGRASVVNYARLLGVALGGSGGGGGGGGGGGEGSG